MSTTIRIGDMQVEVGDKYIKSKGNFKIGSRVKLLKKKYSDWEVYPAIIADYSPFEGLPTLTIMYIVDGFPPKVELAHLHEKTDDLRICEDTSGLRLQVSKAICIERLDYDIQSCRAKLDEAISRRKYLLENFKEFFSEEEVDVDTSE